MGGSWTLLTDTFLVGAGSAYEVGATGGEAEHTLTTEEMPSHTHNPKVGSGGYKASYASCSYGTQQDTLIYQKVYTNDNNWNYTRFFFNADTGGGEPHNNLPPYTAAYMWQRTA